MTRRWIAPLITALGIASSAPAAPIFLAVFVVGLGLAGSSRAAPITWEFEGTVRYANLGDGSALGSSLGVTVGASAFGRIVYESTTPEHSSGNGIYDALIEFAIVIGSYTPSSSGFSFLNTFFVRPASQAWAPYGFEFAMADVTGDQLFPRGPFLTLSLIPNAPGVIPDSSLPSTPPALSDLTAFSIDQWLNVGFATGLQIYGEVTPREVLIEFTRLEAVPEPGVAALLVLSLAAACAFRGRATQPAQWSAASRPRSGRAVAADRRGS
ncbi:MAG: hypothetical protein WEF50_05000 [Myxococcota bacterium]